MTCVAHTDGGQRIQILAIRNRLRRADVALYRAQLRHCGGERQAHLLRQRIA